MDEVSVPRYLLLWRLSTFSMCISLASSYHYRFIYRFLYLPLSLFPCHFRVLGICSPWAYASPCVGRVLMPRGFGILGTYLLGDGGGGDGHFEDPSGA